MPRYTGKPPKVNSKGLTITQQRLLDWIKEGADVWAPDIRRAAFVRLKNGDMYRVYRTTLLALEKDFWISQLSEVRGRGGVRWVYNKPALAFRRLYAKK